MGFYDNPRIDKAAERSEQSVLKTKLLFCLKNGFISREETPDYGVDLDVEMVKGNEPTRNKFVIQIKSSSSFQLITIQGKEYYKMSFLTSRLGYLVRSHPCLGLIVMFNEEESLLYFDYVDAIIDRIQNFKESTDWIYQESTTIYIPKENELNDSSVKHIYDRFLHVFDNIKLLFSIYSEKFNIPKIRIEESNKSDVKDELIEIIEVYGTQLINEFKFGELFYALGKLPISEITGNSRISFIAAIVYSEVGKPIESNMFIQYCKKDQNNLSDEHIDILEFTELKNEFLLGHRSYDKYLDTLEKLALRTNSEVNKLTIRINISQLKLFTAINEKDIDKTILNDLSSLLLEIQNSAIQEKSKQLLIIYQSSNYNIYATKYVSELLTTHKIQESLNINLPLKDRIELARQCINIINIPNEYVIQAYKYGERTNDDLIKANALHKLAYFQFGFHFTLVLIDFASSENKEQYKQVLTNSLRNAIEAFNLFNQSSLFVDAHHSITLAYEILLLASLFHKVDLDIININKITEIINQFEERTGLGPFSSVVKESYNDKQYKKHGLELKELKEEEIQYFASCIKRAYNLPENRRENIIKDIRNRKYFEQHCDTERYELLQNNISGKDIYKYPTDYIIVNKKSQLIIGKSENLKQLIKTTGLEIK
jgi:hypothetical protein